MASAVGLIFFVGGAAGDEPSRLVAQLLAQRRKVLLNLHRRKIQDTRGLRGLVLREGSLAKQPRFAALPNTKYECVTLRALRRARRSEDI